MARRLLTVPLCAAAAIGAALVSPAHAGVGPGSLPLALSAVAALEQGRCAAPAPPVLGFAGAALAPVSGMSKASAILGGQVSRLEALRQQQAGTVAAARPVRLAAAALPGRGLVPRAGGDCFGFVRSTPAFVTMRPGLGVRPLGADDFLASKRLPVSKTSFDAQWSRVRRDTLATGTAAALTRAVPGRAGTATLAAVNSWTNHRIRYAEDSQIYGKPDYWAGARTTLRRGAGDCEDIAIAKLALLAALGVPRRDMYLTIARDLARNSDHAVLVVKLAGRHWLLDNATDRVLDARDSYDYRPILSYSDDRRWLHGY